MGIRETLNKHPSISIGIAVVGAIGAITLMIWSMPTKQSARYGHFAFYSDDDGKSYFEDDVELIPPFDHNGKPAYKAQVFTCGSGKKWVGYLEGYRPEAREKMVELDQLNRKLRAMDNPPPVPPDKDPMYVLPKINHTGLICKKPDVAGQPPNKWVSEADGAAFNKARAVRCEDGSNPIIAVP